MALRRRGDHSTLIWPGFVDAMTALLLVLMFVLSIFMIVQFVLRDELAGRDLSLAALTGELQTLTNQLSLSETERERAQNELDDASLALEAAQLRASELTSALNLKALEAQQLTSEIDRLALLVQALTKERDEANAELASRAEQAEQVAALQAELQQTKEAAAASELTMQEQIAALELAVEQRRAEAEKTLELLAAAEAKQRQLSAEAITAAEQMSQQERTAAFARLALSQQQQVNAEGRRAVALLNMQVAKLRDEIAFLRAQLDLADAKDVEAQAEIQELGARLNKALAQKVGELQQYRSEFFGRIREVLGDRDDIRIVGDRFVFQSEVLFGVGSAQLGDAGKRELGKLAAIINDIASEIPPEINWIIRIDGHTDTTPIYSANYDNWQLSQDRALSVVRFFISEYGVPAHRLAPTGFGEFQPLDARETPAAYAKNRRIEIKLTER